MAKFGNIKTIYHFCTKIDIMQFTRGFEYKGIRYGWKSGELYRLPTVIGVRVYGLKKMNLIPIGNLEGYRVSLDKKTIAQLKAITKTINFKIVAHEDVPA